MKIHQVDYNFLSLRLQLSPEQIERCRPLYDQYRRNYEMVRGKGQPMDQVLLLHIASASMVCEIPSEPVALPATRLRAAVKTPAKPTAAPLELTKGTLVNYMTKTGIYPGRVEKIAKTGKVQITSRQSVDGPAKKLWVERSELAIMDVTPSVYKAPEQAAGLSELRANGKVGFQVLQIGQ